jgi:DNA processing protein
MEQGREVFALPGQVDSIASEGCHDLIRDGVTLVRGVDDVLSALGPLPMPTSPRTKRSVPSANTSMP